MTAANCPTCDREECHMPDIDRKILDDKQRARIRVEKADALRAAIAAEIRGARADAIAECKAASALEIYPAVEDAIEAFRAATWSEALCSLNSDGAPTHVVQASIDAAEALRAIAADKAALDATWRAHDLERDAEVAQAQAATHEACAALQAICAALHVAPPTGSTYCTEAVTMVLERVAADKARAVEGMRPVLSADEAMEICDAYAKARDAAQRAAERVIEERARKYDADHDPDPPKFTRYEYAGDVARAEADLATKNAEMRATADVILAALTCAGGGR